MRSTAPAGIFTKREQNATGPFSTTSKWIARLRATVRQLRQEKQQNMRIRAALIAATFLGCLLPVHAQERTNSSGPAIYKVEFDIRDASDGATQPSQHFSMLVDESRRAVFQAASRVPDATASAQYLDVGVKIECTVHETEGKAALQ
jgi:hypothetical protein